MSELLLSPTSTLIAADRSVGKTEQLARSIVSELLLSENRNIMMVIADTKVAALGLMNRIKLLLDTFDAEVDEYNITKMYIIFDDTYVFFYGANADIRGHDMITHLFVDNSEYLSDKLRLNLYPLIWTSNPRVFETKTITMKE